VVTAPPVRESQPAPADVTGFATVIDTRAAPAGVSSLSDALSVAPGVQVRRFGGLGQFSTVSVRGFSPGQVQVYLDGVPLSRADDEVVNLSDLPLDALERVEVYRGVTPLAFAQSGPGGVVNLVPRRPGAEPLTAASVSGGSFVTRKVNAARSAASGPWEYLAFGQYLGSRNDFLFENDQGTTANPSDDRLERRRNADFNQGGFTGRVGWRPDGPLTLSLVSDSFGKEQGVPGRGSVQSLDASRRVVRQLAQLNAQLTPRGGLPLVATASAFLVYQGERFRSSADDPVFGAQDVTTRTLGGGGQVLVRGTLGRHHVPGLLLAAAHEALAQDFAVPPSQAREAGEAPTRTRLRGTMAAEDEVLLWGDRISLVPAVRVEVYRDDFPADPLLEPALQSGGTTVQVPVSPRFGARAEVWPGVTLLGNVARYQRVPNLQELFGQGGVIVGNPDLQPETSRNWDLGLRLTLPARGPVSGAVFEYGHFDNQVDDLIVLLPVGVSSFKPFNIPSARLRGNEVALRATLWRRLGLVANLTHQSTDITGGVHDGNQVPGLPALESSVRLDLWWSRDRPLPVGRAGSVLWPGRAFFETTVVADNYLDSANTQLVPSRALFNVGLVVAPPPLRGLALGVEVRNLTDDLTRDLLDFPLPGRAVFATVSWGFGAADAAAASTSAGPAR
jgi:iron complex outermembrane receptor protein